MAPRVLALSGPSGSGKSTLAEVLRCVLEAEGWRVTIVHGDSHFLGPKPESYWTQENKDHPGAIDLPTLRAKIGRARDACGDSELVVVEGFMLLQDAEIMALVDGVLFLRSDKERCLGRRLARSVRTAHEAEGLVQYYHRCVWPGYLQYTAPALERLRAASAEAGAERSAEGSGAEGGGARPPLREVDGNAAVAGVAAAAVAALPALFPSLTAAAAAAAAAATPAACALTLASDWAALATVLPAAISLTKGNAEARRSLGLALGPRSPVISPISHRAPTELP